MVHQTLRMIHSVYLVGDQSLLSETVSHFIFFVGNTVLHIAAQNGRDGIIEDLILNGADVNAGNNHKNTAIHLAAQNGFDKVAAHLLRAKKLNVNFKDLHANTAMHLAAQNGQIGVSLF